MILYEVEEEYAIEHAHFYLTLKEAREAAKAEASSGHESKIMRMTVPLTREAMVGALNREHWCTKSQIIETWEPSDDEPRVDNSDPQMPITTYRIRRVRPNRKEAAA